MGEITQSRMTGQVQKRVERSLVTKRLEEEREKVTRGPESGKVLGTMSTRQKVLDNYIKTESFQSFSKLS